MFFFSPHPRKSPEPMNDFNPPDNFMLVIALRLKSKFREEPLTFIECKVHFIGRYTIPFRAG